LTGDFPEGRRKSLSQKNRKNVCSAARSEGLPGRRSKKPIAINHELNSWTVAMCAAWSGMPARTIYRLLRAGVIPSIPMGDAQTHEWPAAHSGKRTRSCYRFIIPRVAFIRWFENIGKPASGVGSSAA
jgi:hypothetical protein